MAGDLQAVITRREFAAAAVGGWMAAKWFPRKPTEPKTPTPSPLRLIDVHGRALSELGVDQGNGEVRFEITGDADVDGVEISGSGYSQFWSIKRVMAGDVLHVTLE
jgi:hypothetical protein